MSQWKHLRAFAYTCIHNYGISQPDPMFFINNYVEFYVINQQIGGYLGFLYKQPSVQRKCFVVTVVTKMFDSRTCLYITGTILGITELFK